LGSRIDLGSNAAVQITGSHSGGVEDSSILGSYALSFGKQ